MRVLMNRIDRMPSTREKFVMRELALQLRALAEFSHFSYGN